MELFTHLFSRNCCVSFLFLQKIIPSKNVDQIKNKNSNGKINYKNCLFTFLNNVPSLTKHEFLLFGTRISIIFYLSFLKITENNRLIFNIIFPFILIVLEQKYRLQKIVFLEKIILCPMRMIIFIHYTLELITIPNLD